MPYSAGVLLAAVLSIQLPARTPDVHFTPTRHNIADAMLRLANVTADDVVYDLGSGDGRLPIIAAQKYGARGIGVEIDPRLVELSWRIANEAEVANRVSFIVGDLFEADLSKATVVTMYLSPSIMKILEPRLRALKPGTPSSRMNSRCRDGSPTRRSRSMNLNYCCGLFPRAET